MTARDDWDGIGPVVLRDAGYSVVLSRNEVKVMEDLEADIRAPQQAGDGRANGELITRLLAKGFEAGTLLYIGLLIAATGETEPDALAMALASRSPNAYPKRLRLYVRQFQAQIADLVRDEDKADAREEEAALRDHFGPDPELFK